FHRLPCCRTIGGKFRVGNGEMTIRLACEDFSFRVDESLLPAPENQPAKGVGEPRSGYSNSLFLQQSRTFRIGSEEDVERRAIADLGVVLSCRTEAENDLNAGLRLEGSGQLLHGTGEIAGRCDVDFFDRMRPFFRRAHPPGNREQNRNAAKYT